MLPHDKALALSAIETEQLRDLRSRLNRLSTVAPAVAGKSIAPLSKGFFDLCARTALPADGATAGDPDRTVAAWAEAADGADIAGLRKLVAGLNELQKANPARWSEVFAGGALQAVISRRLALAGREPPKEGVRA